MHAVLALFAHHAAPRLVLGAFGTGVFQNDAAFVARTWRALLADGGPFERVFEHVVFAVIGGGGACEVVREAFEGVCEA
jgi:uncharacterized protein (TIGR02452 family)